MSGAVNTTRRTKHLHLLLIWVEKWNRKLQQNGEKLRKITENWMKKAKKNRKNTEKTHYNSLKLKKKEKNWNFLKKVFVN